MRLGQRGRGPGGPGGSGPDLLRAPRGPRLLRCAGRLVAWVSELSPFRIIYRGHLDGVGEFS